jgi:hypothetical protein
MHEAMTIHDRARKMVQQSLCPLELKDAYRILGRRGSRKARKMPPVDMTKVRLPYKD